MHSKNKAGCETTSLELRRQSTPVDGLWEEGGEGAQWAACVEICSV